MSEARIHPALSGVAVTSGRRKLHRRESRTAFLMSAPALLGLFLFVVLPFLLAIVFSFTDQRLLSPNATEFVGLRNYERLLHVSIISIAPLRDDSGQISLDAKGKAEFPRLRSLIRANPRYEGFKEVAAVDISDVRYALVAMDPLFWRALANIFLFVLLVVPLQCGAALGCALLVNQKLPGMTFFRTVFFSPVVISMVVISIVWTFLYDRQFGLVAEVEGQDGSEIVAVARISRVHASDDRMLTMVIADAWQRRGVGARIVQTAVAVARGEGVAHLVADLAPDNVGMRDLLEGEGFSFTDRDGTLVASLTI